MIDRYNRTRYMPVVKAGDYLERDMVLSNWDLFEIKRPIRYDSIKRQDIQRPDLISLRVYGNLSYWWILAKVNSIDDIWNDISVGQDLYVPDPNDIKDWILKVRARQRKLEGSV